MNDVLLWLHADCLSPSNPAFRRYPGAPAVFVFDEEEIAAENWSLKRIQFLYECLLEMPVEIRRGQVAPHLATAAQACRARRIVTVDSVNPRFLAQHRALSAHLPVEVLPADPFVDFRGHLDLKRFARYWKRIEPLLLSH